MTDYSAFKVEISDKIAHVAFNRPNKSNALHKEAWQELGDIFRDLSSRPEVRAVILSGEGKNFCAGIDIAMLTTVVPMSNGCESRKREQFIENLQWLQASVSAIEECKKPVLAAVHRACIGGGLDIVAACDMRYCTEDAYFNLKEIDMGLVADLGSLQRLPKIISPGMVREMAYTARNVGAEEAYRIGLVNRVFTDKDDMLKEVFGLAKMIAEKSPVTVRGTKEVLNYAVNHSVEEGLKQIQWWNAAMIFSADIQEAVTASMQRRKPEFID